MILEVFWGVYWFKEYIFLILYLNEGVYLLKIVIGMCLKGDIDILNWGF